ncbi:MULTISPECIES: hypothetical protein [Rhizobium]|uniref:hypothetical protein n=1 Tax=Rhizobium TaxID=379 RepID=UPI001933426D|nr:hypothetical protein [Rhizobium rosettiformans]
MKAYILNETVTKSELSQLENGGGSSVTVELWPVGTSAVPGDAQVVILIVRSTSTDLEAARAMAAVRASVRIVCVYMEEIQEISDLAKKYCSAKVAIGSGGLGAALQGSDAVQQDTSGKDASKTTNKHRNC